MKRRSFVAGALLVPFVRINSRLLQDADNKPLYLFVIGDWGTGGKLQRKVAGEMNALAAKKGKPNAIISTGDNIYPNGVSSAEDPQWKTKFEDIYTGSSIQDVPWVAVLGNHDHRNSITAQVDYGKKNARWIMPSPYFAHRVVGDEGTTASLICLDTQQIMQQQDGWEKQIEWLKMELPKHANADWRLVVGHHPMRSYGHYGDQAVLLKHIKPLMEEHKVQAYMNGHDHDLQVIKNPADSFYCVVSGGGGGSRETKRGKYSLAATSGGGFVSMILGRKKGRINIHPAYSDPLDTVQFDNPFAKV